jgi:transposase
MTLRDDPNTLTYQQLNAFALHEVQGLTIPETAEIISRDESTIDNWKAKPAWRDLAIAAIQEKGDTFKDYADKLYEMKERTKDGLPDGKPDNQAQIKYMDAIEKVFGLAAPTEQKLTVTPEIPDEVLVKQLDDARQKYGMGKSEGKQGTLPEDSGKEQPPVLPV